MFNLNNNISSTDNFIKNNSKTFLSSFRSKIAGAIFGVLGLTSTGYANSNNSDYSNDVNVYRSEYIVKRGDNLSKISTLHGINLEQIFIYNPGLRSRKNLIHPGEKIIVGYIEEKKSPEIFSENISDNIPASETIDFSNYTIQRNDSLWLISRKFGVTINDIVKSNSWLINRRNLIIYPGEKLLIPVNSGIDDKKSQIESTISDTLSVDIIPEKQKIDNLISSTNQSVFTNLNKKDAVNEDNYSYGLSSDFSKIIGENYSNNINPKFLRPDRCGANIREALKTVGFNHIPSAGMHGYVYSRVLNRLASQGKILKVPISHPNDAKPGAILVYDRGFGRPGSPRYNYGHVEQKLENGYFRGHVNETYGGSVTGDNSDTGFTGYAYYILGNDSIEIDNSNGYFIDINKVQKGNNPVEKSNKSNNNDSVYLELNEIDDILGKVKNTGLYYKSIFKYLETKNLTYLSILRNKFNLNNKKIESINQEYLANKSLFLKKINDNIEKLNLAYNKYNKRKLSLEHSLSTEIARGIYILPNDFEEKKSLINIKYKKTA